MTDSTAHIVNVADVQETPCEDGDFWGGGFKPLTVAMQPREGRLGVAWSRTGPGRAGTPFHWHALEDEVFYILAGTGVLRYGDDLYPLRAGDCISCPAGTRVAHQIANTGDVDLEYLGIGKHEAHEVAYFPDSGKVSVRGLKVVGRLEPTTYLDGEPERPRVFALVAGSEPPALAPPQPAPASAIPAPADRDPDWPSPVVNVDTIPPLSRQFGDHWGALFKPLTPYMKARDGRVGVNWMCVAPGRAAVPFHAHLREDEVFYVLSGAGVFRYGDSLTPVKAGDCITCPADTGIAHQLANTGSADLVYLSAGTHDPDEVCTYPDTGKIMVRSIQTVGRLTGTEYMHGEPEPPRIFALAAASLDGQVAE